MKLTEEERLFLRTRSRRVRLWPYVGGTMLVLLTGLGIWLFLNKPLLANPFEVMARLQSDSIPESTMVVMAGLLPIGVLTCLFLAAAVLVFAYTAFANEKKYLRILERCTLQPDGLFSDSSSARDQSDH